MKNNNLDGVFILKDENCNYFSGFTGRESYLLITQSKNYLITDSRYIEQAENEAKNYDVIQYKGNFSEFLKKFLCETEIKRLGFEDEYLTYKEYSAYSQNSICKFVPVSSEIEYIRIIKDDSEIESIKKAAKIADQAFTYIQKFIKAGVTEKDVALEMEYFMKKNGASGLSFDTIVASGARSSLPHGVPTDKKIENGDFVTIDFGCIYNGYCSDMTRTLVIGKCTPKMKEIYDTVLNAQRKALESVREGISCHSLDKIARDYISSKGYGQYFGHGLGHGVGKMIHEDPRVSINCREILKDGMIITDEPGIYIKNYGGVRIEDLLLVKKDGCIVLSESEKEMIIL